MKIFCFLLILLKKIKKIKAGDSSHLKRDYINVSIDCDESDSPEQETLVICDYIDEIQVFAAAGDGVSVELTNSFGEGGGGAQNCGDHCSVRYSDADTGLLRENICTGCHMGKLKILQNLREASKNSLTNEITCSLRPYLKRFLWLPFH